MRDPSCPDVLCFAPPSPSLRQLPALVEEVAALIGALDIVADLVRER